MERNVIIWLKSEEWCQMEINGRDLKGVWFRPSPGYESRNDEISLITKQGEFFFTNKGLY